MYIKDNYNTYVEFRANHIFCFFGGFTSHFIDPGGNELAVWSDKKIIEKPRLQYLLKFMLKFELI